MNATSSPANATAPGAVQSTTAKPIMWWLAGGLGLLGAGALAAALVTGPRNDAPSANPASTAKSAANGKATKASPAKQLAAASVCATCGTVESVKAEKHKGEGTGLGAVGGAVIGGVVGHQMGGGDGKKALTVLGAVGGGLAGHEVEKRARSVTVHRVKVRMEDGTLRTITQSAAPAIGSKVRIENNRLVPADAA